MIAVIEELLDEETMNAFQDAWPKDPQVARAEAANIAAILATPNDDHSAQFLINLCHALIETYPSPLAWISALTEEGAMELRRASKHAKDIPSPSRAIGNKMRAIRTKERQLKPGENSHSLDRDRARLCMLTAATLLMKMRQLIGPIAAIGSGWTLMCAVGESKDKTLQRNLHKHGANREFRRTLNDAVSQATDRWIERNEPDAPVTLSRAALWKSTVPTGIDVMAIFGDGSLTKYRSELFAQLNLDISPPRAKFRLAETDAALICRGLQQRALEKPYSYLSDESERVPAKYYPPQSYHRLRRMMPALTKQGAIDELQALAARSLARKRDREDRRLADQTAQDLLENEIEDWVMNGMAPPPDMRFCDAHLFEQDACRAFLSEEIWLGLIEWRRFEFFPDDPKSVLSIDKVLTQLEKIPEPPAAY